MIGLSEVETAMVDGSEKPLQIFLVDDEEMV